MINIILSYLNNNTEITLYLTIILIILLSIEILYINIKYFGNKTEIVVIKDTIKTKKNNKKL